MGLLSGKHPKGIVSSRHLEGKFMVTFLQRLQKLITWGFCLLTLINFELLEFQHCGGDKQRFEAD